MSYTEVKIYLILSAVSILPFRMYLDFPSKIYLVMRIVSSFSRRGGLYFLLELSKTMVTAAFLTPGGWRLGHG